MSYSNSTNPGIGLCTRLVAAVNRRDRASLMDLIRDGYIDVDVSRSAIDRDGESVVRRLFDFLDGFPDLMVAASVVDAQETRIGVYWLVSTTHTAPLIGVPATGRSVGFCGFTTLQLRDGLIARGLHLWDMAGLLRELRLLSDLTDPSEHFDSAARLFPLLEKWRVAVAV